MNRSLRVAAALALAQRVVDGQWRQLLIAEQLNPRTGAPPGRDPRKLTTELIAGGVDIIQVRAIDVENKGTGTTPAEIVAAMQYLFSDEAGKITGARIPLY